tara:strand:- start:334 stop:1089 length:756 start_codon:yes stop_codon:yes gene_type:complete
MSKKVPRVVDFSFSDTPHAMDMSNIQSEINDVADQGDVYEQSIPDEAEFQIEEKEEIQEEDIFDMSDKMPETVKRAEKDIDLQKDIEELEADIVEKPKQVRKKRKPMSKEHLAKLALAREKAMISRKAKAAERAENKKLDNESKDLVKKAKQKRVQKLKKEIEEDDEEVKPISKGKSLGLTQADLEEAQYQAILKYDALRKSQKAEKKKQQMVEQEKQKMLATIGRATGQTYTYGSRRTDGRLVNRFDNCY